MLSLVSSKLYTYTIGALLLVLGAIGTYISGKRSGRLAQKNKAAEATRERQEAGTDALLEGLTAEEKAANEPIDPDRRYFDK